MSYTPKTWANGDTLSAAALNNIEGGIVANETAIGTKADSSTVSDLATTVSGKASASDLTALQTTVGTVNANFAGAFSTATAYTTGQYVTYTDNKLYRFKADHAAGAWNAAHVDEVTAGSELADLKSAIESLDERKAEIDGYYEELTSGNAEQLISSVEIEDKVPYLFRTSGGSVDIGNRETDMVVGGTVAWKQGVDLSEQKTITNAGVQYVYSGNGTVTATGTTVSGMNEYLSHAIPVVTNHVYLGCGFKKHTGANVNLYVSSAVTMVGNIVANNNSTYFLKKSTISGDAWFYFNAGYADTVIDIDATPQLFDLTQMFGSTIADYIYSLEQATVGAGVAWFRKLFPKDYYAYNAGELMHVQTSAHETTGFNQWDEESEDGYYDIMNNGAKVSSASWKRCKSLIPCVPETTYYFYSNYTGSDAFGALIFYDASMNQISYKTSGVKNATSTTPANCHYMAFYAKPSWFNNDICINLSWDGERDGEYEPYVKHSYPLDSDLVLRGIPKLDSNNQMYYDGDTYESDGTVTRRFGIVDLGSLTWGSASTDTQDKYRMVSTTSPTGIKANSSNTEIPNIICVKYDPRTPNSVYMKNVGITVLTSTGLLAVYDENYATSSSASAFKTSMSGVYLVYELATPTTETADTFRNPQIVDDFGTEEYVDTRTVPIPVGHVTKYQSNLRAKLEMAPNSPDSNGDYVVRHANGTNSYVPLTIPTELPTAPTTNGQYMLKCTVSSGTATYTWASI